MSLLNETPLQKWLSDQTDCPFCHSKDDVTEAVLSLRIHLLQLHPIRYGIQQYYLSGTDLPVDMTGSEHLRMEDEIALAAMKTPKIEAGETPVVLNDDRLNGEQRRNDPEEISDMSLDENSREASLEKDILDNSVHDTSFKSKHRSMPYRPPPYNGPAGPQRGSLLTQSPTYHQRRSRSRSSSSRSRSYSRSRGSRSRSRSPSASPSRSDQRDFNSSCDRKKASSSPNSRWRRFSRTTSHQHSPNSRLIDSNSPDGRRKTSHSPNRRQQSLSNDRKSVSPENRRRIRSPFPQQRFNDSRLSNQRQRHSNAPRRNRNNQFSAEMCEKHDIRVTTRCRFMETDGYCRKGNECNFAHPFCDFDTICTKDNCPYDHTNRRKYCNVCFREKSIPYQYGVTTDGNTNLMFLSSRQ